MTSFHRVISLLVFLCSCVSAQAAQTYNYSYTFNDGAHLSGSFDGDANGNLITNLSNISVNIDGAAFAGNGNLFSSALVCCWVTNGPAVISFDGLQNNFIFSESTSPLTSKTNYLVGTIGFIQSISPNRESDHGADNVYVGNPNNSWSVTGVSAVPEPESYAMLLAGLGVMGFVARRRKQK